MILVDPRRGSGDVVDYFKSYDVPVQLTQMEYGDFAFYGNGPDEAAILCGFERKVLGDMIASMRDKRLAGHQLVGLMENFQVRGLILEGIWQAGVGGLLEVSGGGNWKPYRPGGTSAIMYRELDHFIAELEYVHGVVVERTSNRSQTAAYIVSRYKFFNDRCWEQHDRTDVIYAPFTATVDGGSAVQRGRFTQRTVPKLEKMCAQLDGIERMAFGIGGRWKNMQRLMAAGVEELSETPIEQQGAKGKKTVRLGIKRAESIYRQLREGEE